MNVGTICYTSNQGIAHLARDFHKHGVIDRVFTVRHPHYQVNPDRFPNVYLSADNFLDGLDVLLLFETYLDLGLVKEASKRGVQIVLIPMYEYTPHPFPVKVDLCLCPSLLDLETYRDIYPCRHLPIPVDVPWSLRTTATRFIHNAGHGQYQYAKGTPELLEAMKYVKSNMELLVTAQPCPPMAQLFAKYKNNPKTKFLLEEQPQDQLYANGDVFVYPERINGLSLPLMEAYASGLLVMTTNRFPANTWLPTYPLLPTEGYHLESIRGGSGFNLHWAIVNPQDIAQCIDHWYGKDITEYSLEGKEWAEDNSWEVLKPRYLEALESVCV